MVSIKNGALQIISKPIPLIRPGLAQWWLDKSHFFVQRTVEELNGKSRDKVLLSLILNGSKNKNLGLRRWALELQTIQHSDYGNYLNKFFIKLAQFSKKITQKFVEMIRNEGVIIYANSGYFHSLEHLDPNEALPSIDNQLWKNVEKRYVDSFIDVDYDLDYRPVKKGYLSRILHLTYSDGVRIDIDINTISDNLEPAPKQAIARAYRGIGDRIFPSRFNYLTTPRLVRAKHEKALKEMGLYNQDFETFVTIANAGVSIIFEAIGVLPTPVTSQSSQLPFRRSLTPRKRETPIENTTVQGNGTTNRGTENTSVQGTGISAITQREIKHFRDIDLATIPETKKAEYLERWKIYKGPLKTKEDYMRFRWAKEKRLIQPHSLRQIEQKAGKVAEEFWSSISGDIHIDEAYNLGYIKNKKIHTKFGNVEPDFMPPKVAKRQTTDRAIHGSIIPAKRPEDALFIADTKILTQLTKSGERVPKAIGLTKQIRGLIELAKKTENKMLIFVGQKGAKISKPLQKYAKEQGVEIHVQAIATPSGVIIKG